MQKERSHWIHNCVRDARIKREFHSHCGQLYSIQIQSASVFRAPKKIQFKKLKWGSARAISWFNWNSCTGLLTAVLRYTLARRTSPQYKTKHILSAKVKQQSVYRPWGFQEVEAPRFQDNRHMNVVRLSALRTGHPYPPTPPRKYSWYYFR